MKIMPAKIVAHRISPCGYPHRTVGYRNKFIAKVEIAMNVIFDPFRIFKFFVAQKGQNDHRIVALL